MQERTVDYELLNPTNNTVSINFSDTRGMFTMVALKTFKFNKLSVLADETLNIADIESHLCLTQI